MNGPSHFVARRGLLAAICGALLAGCTDVPTVAEFPPRGGEPQLLINGDDDFDRSAVAAIMVYQPDHFEKPGWRSFCTATLVHKRVLLTAGHCIQGLERQLNAGILHAAWISFQHDPLAHFDIPPGEGNPATSGWYEIESLHNNPDNPDYSDVPGLLAIFPDFHDSGAITLKNRVQSIQPMKLPSRPGEVEALLGRAECIEGSDCGLVAVGYGLTEFPVLQPPPEQLRLTAALRYKSVDPLWVTTLQAAPGASLGAVCLRRLRRAHRAEEGQRARQDDCSRDLDSRGPVRVSVREQHGCPQLSRRYREPPRLHQSCHSGVPARRTQLNPRPELAGWHVLGFQSKSAGGPSDASTSRARMLRRKLIALLGMAEAAAP